MKKLALFLVGAIAGVLVCFIVFYISGLAFESLGIRLYESEADQQRNFNIFLISSLISFIAGGMLCAKKFA
ncbi:hypothetical protein [Candidatus Thiosymbion oneisti]|uniref:hypothetical protein n=1 Tax=Candidatus Thiosymbion oneisti TaxID=589554 RepID=UPI00105E41F7|nr:hypothetical protein [Candidatus Thiosymbion oneisti]